MRLAFGLACAVVVLVGCSTSEAGTPRPAGADGTVSEAPGTEETNPLEGVGQCDLLTPDELRRIGLKPGRPLGDNSCDYERSPGNGVLLSLFADVGADGLGDPGDPVDVGDGGDSGAYLRRNPDGGQGGCLVTLPTSDASHVLIGAVTRLDTELACNLATAVAEYVYSGLR